MKKNEITIRISAAEYLTYVASIGEQESSIEVRYENENIWLTQKMLATIYDVSIPTINEHINKIFFDNELDEISTIRNFRIVQNEGNGLGLAIVKSFVEVCDGKFDIVVDGDMFKAIITFKNMKIK